MNKEHLIRENLELQEKIEKLEVFLANIEPWNITEVLKSLLNIQLNAMKTYNQCLVERLLWLNK